LRERFDGAGYPLGLSGRSIPIGSRLLAVAETFDALTSERPHRRSRTYEEALRLITAEAGQQFDPHFANLLARVAAEQQEQWQQRIARARADLRTCSTARGEPRCS
jgi:HD-GYP domain-containing protein (c-di-GMP phosphodiesterase class II)